VLRKRRLAAPLTTVVELTRKPVDDLLMLHLLNYDSGKPAQNIAVDVSLPEGRNTESVTLLSPDGSAAQKPQFVEAEGSIRFTVLVLAKYSLAVVKLESRTEREDRPRLTVP